jgi:hypothetical protein
MTCALKNTRDQPTMRSGFSAENFVSVSCQLSVEKEALRRRMRSVSCRLRSGESAGRPGRLALQSFQLLAFSASFFPDREAPMNDAQHLATKR